MLSRDNHFNSLRKSYEQVGEETWKLLDFSPSNLEVSRNLFTDSSLAIGAPQPKALEVYALLSGLPFTEKFTTPLIDVQRQISKVLEDSLCYWVAQPNLGLEYCVFKWPDGSWRDENLKVVQQELASVISPPYCFQIRGIQINPDGCVVAKGFDDDSRLFAIRGALKSRLSFLPKKQSQWAHVPLGRILEPLGTEKFALLNELISSLNDVLIAETVIDVMRLVHETRWYMEERTTLAEFSLSGSAVNYNHKKPNIVAIVQARMGSSRLPQKSLMDLSGKPLLNRLLLQMRGSSTLSETVIATSEDAEDDVIEEFAKENGYKCIRGSAKDVLSRYAVAAEQTNADIVVRLTGDCPLHSPDTIDEVVSAYLLKGDVDYVCNTDPYSRPDGQDVEVFSRELLDIASRKAVDAPDREHVTLWMRRNADIRKLNVDHGTKGCASLRWSVDHQDDMEFARTVWTYLDNKGLGPFMFEDIMQAVNESGAVQGSAIINEGYYLSLFKEASSAAAPKLMLDKSFKWLERSENVIPGGAQTYSKSWRHHIRGVTPIFLEKGKGEIVTDVDGNNYVDLIQGLLPNILGYAREEVDRAAFERAQQGHSFSLPHPIEVVLAERLCQIIPCAEMVRFGKNGSDATAGAVRAARAITSREHVALCGYHGWQDWFIGSTSRSMGVPKAVCELAHPFPYNDPQALDDLLGSKPGEFAAVIMEPVNFHWPDEGYLQAVKEIAHRHGALLIFDEICSGFHFGLGGAQEIFGVMPDMATFGKAMGNGWPISCIVGRSDVMKIFEDAFVSFTFAGDVAAMAAAMKVLDILEQGDAYARMTAAGTKLFDGARVMAAAAGLKNQFKLEGHPHWSIFSFVDKDGNDDIASRALWLQEVTRRGVLILTTFNISAALDETSIAKVLSAFAHGFKRVSEAKKLGIDPILWLDGPVPVPAFKTRG